MSYGIKSHQPLANQAATSPQELVSGEPHRTRGHFNLIRLHIYWYSIELETNFDLLF